MMTTENRYYKCGACWGRNFKKGRNINIDTALDDRVNIGE